MDKDYFICRELFYKTAKTLPTEIKAKYYDALMEYGLYGTLPEDGIILSLLQWAIYSIQKSKEIRQQKSEWWQKHKWNQYTKGDTKWEAQKNTVEDTGTHMEDNGTEWKKEDIEDIEDKEEKEISKDISKKKNDMFETFWKEYPHARKGKKNESKIHFLKQDSDEVMKQVQILKRKLKAWLVESKYIPACERWIRDFTPINEDVIKQDLSKICRWHLNCGWDIKQRATELKQTFGEQQINEIVKAIQQKDSPKNLFLNQT